MKRLEHEEFFSSKDVDGLIDRMYTMTSRYIYVGNRLKAYAVLETSWKLEIWKNRFGKRTAIMSTYWQR